RRRRCSGTPSARPSGCPARRRTGWASPDAARGSRRSRSPCSCPSARLIRMGTLPDLAVRLLDGNAFWVLSTVNTDGSPQSSVIWARRDGDEFVFSTILGRRKTRNMQRDPRVSLLAYDPADPYSYVEARGAVTMTTD